jgi:hypothetical protein
LTLDPRPQRGASTIDFSVETRATGSFPLQATVYTPDGRIVLSRVDIVVRSTAVSAVALAATGGGALFLLFAWVRRSVRRRKARTVHPVARSR